MEDQELKWAVDEAAMQESESLDGNETEELNKLKQKHSARVESTLRKMRAKQPAHPWYALYVR